MVILVQMAILVMVLICKINDDGWFAILIFVLLPWYYSFNCNNKVVLICQGIDDGWFAILIVV